MATIYAALLGAGAAAVFQYLVGRGRIRGNHRAILAAVIAEVGVLADLLRIQYRPDGLTPLAGAISRDPHTRVFPFDPAGGYFSVYDGLGARLGELGRDEAATVVQFYTYYRVALALADPRHRDSHIDDATLDLLLDLARRIAAFEGGTR